MSHKAQALVTAKQSHVIIMLCQWQRMLHINATCLKRLNYKKTLKKQRPWSLQYQTQKKNYFHINWTVKNYEMFDFFFTCMQQHDCKANSKSKLLSTCI